MLAHERLDQIQVKVRRAHAHYADLVSAVHSYLATKPYAISTRRDTGKGLIYFVSSIQPTPTNISAILGDTIHNLRSALDHLAYQLVFVGAGRLPSSKAYFPIADNAAKYVEQRGRQINGATPQAISMIDALEPYRGGNDTLWKLHKLDNVDKHRVLITAGSAFRSINLGSYMCRSMQRQFPRLAGIDPKQLAAFFRPEDRLFPLKAGDELFIDGPEAEIDETLEFQFDVAIGEPDIIVGEPILEVVKPMIDLVEQIVSSFEPMLG